VPSLINRKKAQPTLRFFILTSIWFLRRLWSRALLLLVFVA